MHVAMCSKSHLPSCHSMISPIGTPKIDWSQGWSNPQVKTGHCKEYFLCKNECICMYVYCSGRYCNRYYSECNYFHRSTGCR